MTDTDTELILTNRVDTTADRVVVELERLGVPVFRFDPSEFPRHLRMTATLCPGGWATTLRTEHRSVALGQVRGVLYRRPSQFQFGGAMSEPERRWAAGQARLGFAGLLSGLPPERWLNHPGPMRTAELKLVQLQVAQASGLAVAPTLVTSDPAAMRSFAERVGDVVYKPLGLGGLAEEGTLKLLYTTRVEPSDWGDPSVARTLHLFQAWVDKTHDVRLTVVDDEFFAVEIHALSAPASVDWRSDYDALRYVPIAVPAAVRAGVKRLMDRLELRFGALDFSVRRDGAWLFLEVNPNGQWLWIEDATGLPVAAAVAAALAKGPPLR